MSTFKDLARIRDLTGWTLRLRVEESVQSVVVNENSAWVVVNRARTEPRRNGYVVKQRGYTTILFNRDTAGVWHRDEETLWLPATPPQHVVAWHGTTPEEHAERVEWEDLCYRPGTPEYPMDGPERIAAGYDWYKA